MRMSIVVTGLVLLFGAAFFVFSDLSVEAPVVEHVSEEEAELPMTLLSQADEAERIEASVPIRGVGPDTVTIPTIAEWESDGHNLQLGAVLADNEAYTRYTVTYQGSDLTISGIMNIPKGSGPFPLLLLNHGYIDPAVYTNGRGLKREQDWLARQGYAVLHSDYRNHAFSDKDSAVETEFRLPYVEDVINGVYAVREAVAQGHLPSVDASRVGMLGHSMGGGVTLNVIVSKPELISAAVLFAPVSGYYPDNFQKWTMQPSRADIAEKSLTRYGDWNENPEFWAQISAETYYDQIRVPVMNHHGTADESVPLAWSERMVAAMEGVGVDVTYHIYPGELHEFGPAWTTVMQRTTTFFDKVLKNQ